MSAKAIREETGKRILNAQLANGVCAPCRFAAVTEDTDWNKLVSNNPWLLKEVIENSSYLFT